MRAGSRRRAIGPICQISRRAASSGRLVCHGSWRHGRRRALPPRTRGGRPCLCAEKTKRPKKLGARAGRGRTATQLPAPHPKQTHPPPAVAVRAAGADQTKPRRPVCTAAPPARAPRAPNVNGAAAKQPPKERAPWCQQTLQLGREPSASAVSAACSTMPRRALRWAAPRSAGSR